MKKYNLTIIEFQTHEEMEQYINSPQIPLDKIVAFYNSPLAYKIILNNNLEYNQGDGNVA